MEKKKKKDSTIKIIHLTRDPLPSEFTPVNKTRIAEGILGYCARLISWSKSTYRKAYPNHKLYSMPMFAPRKMVKYGTAI